MDEEMNFSVRDGSDTYTIRIKKREEYLYLNDGKKCWQALQKHKRQGGLPIRTDTSKFNPVLNSTMTAGSDEDCRSPVAKRGRNEPMPNLQKEDINDGSHENVSNLDVSFSQLSTNGDEDEEILASSLSDIEGVNDDEKNTSGSSVTDTAYTSLNQRVLVTNLPKDFQEFILQATFKSHLCNNGTIEKDEFLFMMVLDPDPALKGVVVEFETEFLARAAADLREIFYLGEKISLAYLKKHPDPLNDPKYPMDNKVVLSGFSKGCEEFLLRAMLKGYLINAGILNNKDALVLKIEGCSDEAKEIIIEFENETLAEAAASLCEIHYLADKITVTLFLHHQKSIFQEKDKKKVVLTGFSKGCEEFLLKATLKGYLINAGIINNENALVLNLEGCSDEAKEIIIEFENETLAEAAASLCEIHYLADKITMTLLTQRNSLQHDDGSFEEHDESLQRDDKLAHFTVGSLDSKRGTSAFLRACFKCNVVPFKGTQPNLEQVQKILFEDYGLETTTQKLARKKKTLDELYRRNPCNEYAKELAYLRGEKDSKWPESFEVDDDNDCYEEDVLKAAKFTKGKVMSTRAIHALISVWEDKREEYWSVHKDSRFYRTIAVQMVLRGYNFSPEQCKNKMKELEDEYKTYTKSLKMSGRGRPRPFEFYVPLQPILQSMVSVEPEQTYAVGATVASTSNSLVQRYTNSERFGRARPAAQNDKKEENKELLKMLVESRKDLMVTLKEIAAKRSDSNNNSK